MELFIGKQLQVVAYSFILGLIFGGLYDIIRIVYCLCGIASYTGASAGMRHGKLPFFLFFLLDTVYMIVVTAMFSVFLYWQMSGTFRLFVLSAVIAGFSVYHSTVGRLVMLCSETIVRFLRWSVHWVLIRPVRWLLRILQNGFVRIYRQTIGRALRGIRHTVRRVRAARIRRTLRRDIGICKSKELS